MIPDRLTQGGASAGEKKLFSVLQDLPEDYIVYYEPVINERYPDFLVICPDMGLLVIEVKGWYPKDIIGGDSNNIIVLDKRLGKKVPNKHPVRQARDYMYGLMDKCREYPESKELLHLEGEYQNRFIFPFGHFAVLSNVTSDQLKNHSRGDFTKIFPPEKVATREILESWKNDPLSAEQLCDILRSYFDPFWSINKLTESQIDTLRAIVHPEIIVSVDIDSIISDINFEDIEESNKEQSILKENNLQQLNLKVLDLKQEKNARMIGQGHRIVYGVAGSGKTVLLIARAKLVSREMPKSEILLLCYNVTLAAYLRGVLKSYKNIKVLHFDGWAKKNGVTRQIKTNESDRELGDRLLESLEQGNGDYRKYDVVMVDEAQDFEVSWFKCVLEAMKEPLDGDLLIVGDGSQGLYPRGRVSWKEIGIQAVGRAYYKKFDLDKNYRNPREVIELATVFATKSNQDDEDAIVSIKVDPNNCVRSSGVKPVLLKSKDKNSESIEVIKIVKNLLDGQWFGNKIDEPLQTKDIGIFYPLMYKKDRKIMEGLVEELENLEKVDRVIWLTDPKNTKNKALAFAPGIKIQTIHSAKGLQYKAVILLWTNNLPRPDYFDDADEAKDRRLLYVGLTRPEDFLVISSSGRSKFIDEIEKSGKMKIVDSETFDLDSFPF